MVWKGLFILLLVAALADDQVSDSQNAIKTPWREVLATARKDAQGLVSPTEYGRLLLSFLNKVKGVKKSVDWEGVVEDYVSTLTGRLDPTQIPADISNGAFSKAIAQADHLHRRVKREL